VASQQVLWPQKPVLPKEAPALKLAKPVISKKNTTIKVVLKAALDHKPKIKVPHAHKPPVPAESGHPETLKEFVAQMKSKFTLWGPAQHLEGKRVLTPTDPIRQVSSMPATKNSLADWLNMHTTVPPLQNEETLHKCMQTPEPDKVIQSMSLVELTSADDLDLLAEIKGHYAEDAFFRVIMEQPKEFRNFEISEGLIYLLDWEQKLLCIPQILIGKQSA
jgi:hypothetical protein